MNLKWVVGATVLTALSILISCNDDEATAGGDAFDRSAMLENWADNIIIPGYESYVASLEVLDNEVKKLTENPHVEQLGKVRAAWLAANLEWQAVAKYEIGKAEEMTLINFTNIYPTNTEDMIETIESGSYDLSSVNKQDEQGFPAIEYLIYGLRSSDEEIVDVLNSVEHGESYKNYLNDLSGRLKTLAQTVLDDWKNGYRDAFVGNDGSNATSSVNKLVNDFIFYYEKHLRAGKVGIPAGVFSGSASSEKVEGIYSGTSKELLLAGLNASQAFFNGSAPGSAIEGESLKSYLDFMGTITAGESLADVINAQFDASRSEVELLSDDFQDQVITDNNRMLKTYDELQKNVVFLKTDMMQVLNIRVDYVDADGD